MGSYDVNKVNLELMGHYCSNFVFEKKHYSNIAYSTFINSYLNNCDDPYIRNMSANLKTKYSQIYDGYNNIIIWWQNYNEELNKLEAGLVNVLNNANEKETIFSSFSPSQTDNSVSEVRLGSDDNMISNIIDYPDYIDYLNKKLAYHNMIPSKIINYVDASLLSILDNNSDKYAKTIAQNLYKVFHLNSSFYIEMGDSSAFVHNSSSTIQYISLDDKTIQYNTYNVFYHELFHFLDDCFGSNDHRDFASRCDAYQAQVMASSETRQKLYYFTSELYYNQAKLYNEIKDSEEVRMITQRLREEVALKDTSMIIADYYAIDGQDANKDSLGLNKWPKEQLEGIYVAKKQADMIYYLVERDYRLSGQANASDIVDAMVRGQNEICFDEQSTLRTSGHSEKYFADDNHVYGEQIADFATLKMLGRQDLLDKLKDIYGNEWYDFLNNKYQNYALTLQNME